MDGSCGSQADPAWKPDTTRLVAFYRGVRETPVIPPLILTTTFVGFGALTSQTGLTWLDTLFISMFMFALPGQLVLVDEMARGASILTAAIAVAATGVRLLPMTVMILPIIRDRQSPKWIEIAVAQYIAVTTWVESMRRAPHVPRHLRSAYCLGICLLLVCVSSTGGIVGFVLAPQVPTIIAAGLIFMTPIYFLLSMLITARSTASVAPILFGIALGPVFHMLLPSFDLVLTGLTGGTAAFLLERYRQKKRSQP
jgi:predicted branched-subunit amino acid permease